MSPVAVLLDQTLALPVILATLACEWGAVWFTLGRSAIPTLALTLIANGTTLAMATLTVQSGALGSAEWKVEASLEAAAWIGAWLLILAVYFLVEALVLRTCMRRSRPTWHWNPYDLLTFLSANAITLSIAVVALWLKTQG